MQKQHLTPEHLGGFRWQWQGSKKNKKKKPAASHPPSLSLRNISAQLQTKGAQEELCIGTGARGAGVVRTNRKQFLKRSER